MRHPLRVFDSLICDEDEVIKQIMLATTKLSQLTGEASREGVDSSLVLIKSLRVSNLGSNINASTDYNELFCFYLACSSS